MIRAAGLTTATLVRFASGARLGRTLAVTGQEVGALAGQRGKTVRLLHASDVHLGGYADDDEGCIPSLIQAAKQYSADVVLLVGDTFDHNRVSTEFGQAVVDQLGELTVPVVVLPGNHDCLADGTIWKRVTLPANVTLLSDPAGQSARVADHGIVIWGRPHADYFDMRPLMGIPEREEGAWHVALAHGHFTDDLKEMRSYLLTTEQIANSRWDYIALGHWHVPTDISSGNVAAIYCGSASMAKACALVTLSEEPGMRRVQVDRMTLADGGATFHSRMVQTETPVPGAGC
jgi:DNA repair protein SbcD/Mre11